MSTAPHAAHLAARHRVAVRPAAVCLVARSGRESQSGAMLLEALIAILLFSIAILGLAGLQARGIEVVRDAEYRAQASHFANQIVGHMWADRFNVPLYALNAGAGAACVAGNNQTANPVVGAWLNGLGGAGVAGALPGASGLQQQIEVAPDNVVTVTVCWQAPQDAAPHSFTMTAQIQG